jgi:hypothetical protein
MSACDEFFTCVNRTQDETLAEITVCGGVSVLVPETGSWLASVGTLAAALFGEA